MHPALGVILRGARAEVNLALFPKAFDNAEWSKNGATVTADQAAAPDGTTTADRIELASSGQGTNYVQQLVDLGDSSSASKTVTIFCWLRSLSGTQNLALKNTQSAVADHFSNITVTTEWTRFIFAFTNGPLAGNGFQNVGLTGHSDASAVDVYAWDFRAVKG